jgi:hypothetical protein
MKLLKTEEEVIVQHILDLDARGFPPWLATVKDMADSLLAEQHCKLVGQNKFNQKYDYRRALCKDSEVTGDWFRLVHNMKAKHGTLNTDTYNSDETGFMMG